MAASHNQWPSSDDFTAVRRRLDDAVHEVAILRDKVATFKPPVFASQVSDLRNLCVLVDLDLRVLRGLLDELLELRGTWASWAVKGADDAR